MVTFAKFRVNLTACLVAHQSPLMLPMLSFPDLKNAFWRAYPMFEKRNITFEALATPRLFIENPRLAWGFYGMRLK
ncbi:hypothetical protein NUS63_10385, partial [Glaesserella parasuis]|nr:hypothetical protein [Glaesserella parasuis]